MALAPMSELCRTAKGEGRILLAQRLVSRTSSRSYADGAPPRWIWPRIVTRDSNPRLSSSRRTSSLVIFLPVTSCAPSAMMMMLLRLPISLPRRMTLDICSGHSTDAGHSGMKTQSAPVAVAPLSASQPQLRPMTSTTKSRWCEAAVDDSVSTACTIRCSALSQPIVMSVPAMSLSMLPTNPTTLPRRRRRARYTNE